jgi:carbon monoxide dehydrogenase subunit G
VQLEHSFTVPVGVDDAWKVLLDIERVVPCMPGAALDSVDGDNFTGTVKVKLGPIGLTYKGKASFVEKDEAAHRATINAQGRDARGNGTASARVTASLTEAGGETKVDVVTDLDITGKPAQFGRGVMVDVGNKLIGQFADCLAGKLAGGDGAAESEPAAATGGVAAAAESAAVATSGGESSGESAEGTDGGASGAGAKPAAKRSGAATKSPAASAEAAPEAAPDAPAGAASGPVMAAQPAAAAQSTASQPAAQPASQPSPTQPASEPATSQPARATADEVEPINLLQSAGPAIAKRLIPVLALLVLVLIVIRLRKR